MFLRRFLGATAATAVVAGGALMTSKVQSSGHDFTAIRKRIADSLDDENYEDGSRAGVIIRLGWHLSGTYDAHAAKNGGIAGGSNGGTMRFNPEANHGANSGLHVARVFLEPIKRDFPHISYADLYTLAAAVAIEETGGPHIPWRAGRVDHLDGGRCPPDGRLPDAAQGAAHVRDVFYRMGFNDQEIVALIGAHSLGRMHVDRSGYDGPWTNAPTTFSNEFFRLLLEAKWTPRKWSGPKMFVDESGKLFMTPADMCFVEDPVFREYVSLYARDDNKFRSDFAAAFSKLLELGCDLDKSGSSGSSIGSFFSGLFGKK